MWATEIVAVIIARRRTRSRAGGSRARGLSQGVDDVAKLDCAEEREVGSGRVDVVFVFGRVKMGCEGMRLGMAVYVGERG
jgi:hypothetical protein